MITISQILDNATKSCNFYIQQLESAVLKIAKEKQLDTTTIQKIFENVSKKSVGIAFVGTTAGVYFAARACYSSKLSTTQKVVNFAVSAACFAAAGFEVYANGVNLELIKVL